MKSIFIALCLMLLTFTAAANQHGLVLNLGSRHLLNDGYEYNEKNYGLGYTHYWENGNATQVGFYDNSYEDLSVYIAYKVYGNWLGTRVKPYFLIGAVTGYKHAAVIPMPAVGLDLEIIKTHKINIMAAPIASQVNKSTNGSRDYETNYGLLLGFQYEKLF